MKKAFFLSVATILLAIPSSRAWGQSTYWEHLKRAVSTLVEHSINQQATPFPQSGTIPVYKYSMGQKNKIGELKWTATIEARNNSQWGDYKVLNLTVHNTTNEHVKGWFSLLDITDLIRFEVAPGDTWQSGELIKDHKCSGVKPGAEEITL